MAGVALYNYPATGAACSFPGGNFADSNPICDWTYRYPVTIDHTKVAADLTNYLLYVDLSGLPSAFFTNVKVDGSDIRVTKSDGSTELAHYVGSIDDITETGTLWVRYDGTLSSTVNTVIYIYFGNASASAYATTATYGRNNTFQDYEAFWDFEQDPSGAAPQLVNLTGTSSGFDRTSTNLTADELVTSKIGKGWDFDAGDFASGVGSGDFSFMQTKFTIGTWSKLNGTGLHYFQSGDGTSVRVWQFRTNGSGYANFIRFNSSNAVVTNIAETTNRADGSHHYFVAKFDNAVGSRLYVDGNSVANDSVTINNNAPSSFNALTFNILSRNIPTAAQPQEMSLAWMRGDALSDNYISTEYANQNTPSTFYTIGTIETS